MRNVLGVVVLSILLAAGAFAQQTSLAGTVVDPTGAVIPGATISIRNGDTGLERDATSDSQGRYTFVQVVPGKYKLTAKAAGFAEVVINNVELQVNQPATMQITFDKVGATSTVVSVESTATQVNTTDATLGNAIGTQAITELPFFARNITNLLAAQPGVTIIAGSNPNATSPDSRSGSVNGGKPDQANITLDGVDVNPQSNRNAFTSVLRVTLDSVEEFRSTTTNANADQGRSSGAQVSLVTRSGTNELHGALYEYHRNTITAANSFFNNRSGVARPALLINVFGGRVGGPIVKNRSFFFLNYEGRRDASSQSVLRTVPSDDLRNGIIKYIGAGNAIKTLTPTDIKTIVDPAGIGANPNILKLFNDVYPHANDLTVGDTLNFVGYRFSAPVKGDQNTYIAKFDHRLDEAGKHTLFVRGSLQNDSSNSDPQFPGQPPRSVTLANNKGLAAGYTALIRNNLISTFRYGFTRQGGDVTGVQTTPVVTLRSLSQPYGTTLGLTRIIPVHTITEDLAWTKGAHDVRFGAQMRFISNNSINYGNAYNSATTNASWLKGTGADLTPASLGVSSGFLTSYQDATMALLGIVSQANGRYNYLVDGTILPAGSPVNHTFANEEYETYVQDTWKVTRNFTITAGLRVGLMPAVYEKNGQQISSNIPLDNFVNSRGQLAAQGLSQTQAGVITYLANARPLYPNHINTAPRLSAAYSPKAEGGLSKFFFGGSGKSSIRAGAGMFYDLIGQPLAGTYDQSAFGLSTNLPNSAGVQTALTAPRFTSFFSAPASLIPPAAKGGFPATFPNLFSITNTLDDNLKAPYTMNMNFTMSREFKGGLFVQASYVGRLSRHSLLNRDMAMPTNIKDPKSGQTYFEAASQMSSYLLAGGSPANIPKIPFFENLFSRVATNGQTATQLIALDAKSFSTNGADFTTTLTDIDDSDNCDPTGPTKLTASGGINYLACGDLGPFALFNQQFSALSAWSSIGKGSYHAMQWTVRKRFSQGLTFDLNYTLSKSIDLGSSQENAGSFSGFVQNTWNVSQMRAVSSYDALHQVNAYGIWQVPVGRGRKFLGTSNKIVDAILGGWQISGAWVQSSGLPFSVTQGRKWPTNWNVTPYATPNGNAQVAVTNNSNAPPASGTVGGPNLWSDPATEFKAWGFTIPGQTGSVKTLRGAGVFNIDSGVSKTWKMPYAESHTVQFRWESFNLTNSVRFDPASANNTATTSSSFGKLTDTLNSPRQMQFALRYEF
jgi:hypothetical protein